MNRVYNFNPGPATLPESVLQQAKKSCLEWKNLGMSILEISHRSPEFIELSQIAEADCRALLSIPDHYKVLFLQGGGRSQFAMVPLNLLGEVKRADYLETGVWSKMAIAEARLYGKVQVVASSADTYCTIPPQNSWQCQTGAAYFHYVDNETVNGVEFPTPPFIEYAPLVADMSSNILSRTLDISQFGLIYAAAQKNLGPAGITLVIIREDLLGHALSITPSMFNYTIHANAHSFYNTPPTFAWYVTALVLQWVKAQGGIAVIEAMNQRKANKLYTFIDGNDFYKNTVDKPYRSRMNVVFQLADELLNSLFLQQAAKAGLMGLKGHSLVGGMRASLYNAMPEAGVDALIHFMATFAKQA